MSFAALAEWAGGVSDGGDINIKNDMTSLFRRIGIDANANCGPAMRLLLHATKRHAAAAVNFLYGEEGITTAELNFADGQPQPNDFPSTWKGAMTLSTLSECIVRRKDLHEWGGKSVWGALRIGKYSEEGAERLQCLGEYNAAKKRFLAPLEKTTVIYPKRNSRTAVAPT
jgi:hypothetical protein